MAYTAVCFTILLVTAVVFGAGDWVLEHNWNHAIIATYLTGAIMIFGADWVLQRTAWGRKHSPVRLPPDRLD